MTASNDHGVITRQAHGSVAGVADRLVAAFQSHDLQVFARIDQQEAARQRGLDMPPMQLILFGNPESGTPLMIAHPSLAIDLPLKALAWEDTDGGVWVSYNDPLYLQQRHGLSMTPFGPVAALIESVLETGSTV